MTSYKILRETSPGEFKDTGDRFEGDLETVSAHLADLQAAHGACFAAEQITEA
jgi:hypothetical protein